MPLFPPPFPSSLDSELTSLCQSVLEDFNLCLFYLPSSPNLSLASEDEEEHESGYAFLPDLLIFQMLIICLMGVHSLKRAGNSLCPSFLPHWRLRTSRPFRSSLFVNFPPQAALALAVSLPGCWSTRDKEPHPKGLLVMSKGCSGCPPLPCPNMPSCRTQAPGGLGHIAGDPDRIWTLAVGAFKQLYRPFWQRCTWSKFGRKERERQGWLGRCLGCGEEPVWRHQSLGGTDGREGQEDVST